MLCPSKYIVHFGFSIFCLQYLKSRQDFIIYIFGAYRNIINIIDIVNLNNHLKKT